MASFTGTPNSSSLLRLHYSSPLPLPVASPITPLTPQQSTGVRRRLVATRAGPPGANTYLFAFLFPLSLLAVTVFTSILISDKLDRDFYQQLEVNQSILEAEEEEEEDEDEEVAPAYEEPPSQQRSRNRPKREAEISGR